MTTAPLVHLLCGLNGAGKTTLARDLGASLPAVRFSLDDWMLWLYPGVHFASPEYGQLAESCKLFIWDIARQALEAGKDVVLDWNQWSRARRALWLARATDAGFGVVLHHVQTPLDTAIERASLRTLSGEPGSHAVTEADVRHLARIFEEPADAEGLRILRIPGV